MYLKRKIDVELKQWYEQKEHSPCLVYGVRQCGKTSSILEFSHNNFKNVNYINFWKTPNVKDVFDDSLEVDEIIKKLTGFFPNFQFEAGNTILIFDEVQDCPKARLSLKSFKEDGRFEVIASGSYIGLNVEEVDPTPLPIGSEDIIQMTTFDFEEFLWAMGYGSEKIDTFLYQPFLKKSKIEAIVHKKMQQLFKEYLCIGGYPETVKLFVSTNNFNTCYRKNLSLISEIKNDPSKRKTMEGKALFSPGEIFRIQAAFDAIATFSNQENKRFVVSQVIKGNSDARHEAINYLTSSKVAFKVYNLTVPATPLGACILQSDFKLFYSDIGVLVAKNGFGTIKGILNDSLGMNKGNIFESAIASELYKNNIPVYYFAKRSGLEVDFVISYEERVTLIEVKARNGNAKSSKTIMNHPEHYGETRLIKFGDYNIGEEGKILTLPHYLAFILGRYYTEDIFSEFRKLSDEK